MNNSNLITRGGILAIFLAPLNLIGIDPADIIIVALSALILPISPKIYTLTNQNFTFKALSITFLLSTIAATLLNPIKINIVAQLTINILLFFILYASTTTHRYDLAAHKIIQTLAHGFVLTNLSFLLLHLAYPDLTQWTFDVIRHGRFMGSLGDPNFSGLVASLLGIWLIDQFLFHRKNIFFTLRDGLYLIVVIGLLIATQSRAAWAAFVFGTCVFFYFSWRHLACERHLFRFALLFGTAPVLLIALLIMSGNVEKIEERISTFSEQQSGGEEDRFAFTYTAAAINAGLETPFGHGPGQTATVTGITSVDGDPIGAHNTPAQILAENGWIAFVACAIILIRSTARLRKLSKTTELFHGVSYRYLLSSIALSFVFGLFHDILFWRIAWVIPSLALIASFEKCRMHAPRAPAHCASDELGRPERAATQNNEAARRSQD